MVHVSKPMDNLFTLDHDADTNGCSLLTRVEGVTEKEMNRVFGRASDPYGEENKGYTGSWYFTGSNGVVFTVYFRYGMARIGGWDENHLVSFASWLNDALNRADKLSMVG